MLSATSLFPQFLCLGLVIILLFPRLLDEARLSEAARWQLAGVVFASGLLLNYFVVLAVGSLWRSLAIEWAIALIALGAAIGLHRRAVLGCLRLGVLPLLVLTAAASLFATKILLEPLAEWDARSIWFFHARIIHYAGGLFGDAGLSLPEHAFSHPDYPKLVPVLAAQVAGLAGYWNEQLPKMALLLLLLPAMAITASYRKAAFAAIALVVLVWVRLGPSLVTGYVDAHLAMYGLFGVLLLGGWLARGSLIGLVGGAVFIAIAVGLKNEGSLLAVAVLLCTAPIALHRRAVLVAQWQDRQEQVKVAVFLVALGLGVGMWFVLRSAWGLSNDLQLGFRSLGRMAARLSDIDALEAIAQYTLVSNGLLPAAAIGLCSLGLSVLLKKESLLEPTLCLAVGAIYVCGIEAIYLATPADLLWHLDSSASRVTLLPTVLFLAPAFLFFREGSSASTAPAKGDEDTGTGASLP